MYEEQTYEEILERMLDRVPESLDTRESSFLFNSSAPVAVELLNMYLALDNIYKLTFFDTSDRAGKLHRCKERGIDLTQFDATSSIVVLNVLPVNVEVPVGSRWNYNTVNFTVTEKIGDGQYHMRCESTGTVGNVTGAANPIDYIAGLQSAEITNIHQWGEDEADIAIINEVYYNSLNSQAFGGNRADYLEKVKRIEGVGGVKIYSAAEWKGGGTVRVVFTTSSFTKPTESFVESIQTLIDPIENQGGGYGLAPIGHTVTVDGVSESAVNIGMILTLQSGYTWEDVVGYVEASIDAYFQILNSTWADLDSIIVRISQIETRILDIAGVIDISGTTLNGVESNITIDKDSIVVRGDVNATT